MENKKTITAVMISYNAERFIRGSLESIKNWVDEIIVVDMFSSDKTVEIARRYTDKIFQDKREHGEARVNMGIEKAKSDWILRIHTTERITPELKKEIIDTINNNEECVGYHIPRKSYIYGIFMEERPGPLYLFKRGAGKYPCIGVHEQIQLKGEKGYLKNFKIHYSAITIEDLIEKGNSYTSYDAKMVFAGHPRAFGCKLPVYRANLFNMTYRAVWGFFSVYILGKGYKYGMLGFIFAIHCAFWNFMEIAKLYELQYKKEHSIDDMAIPLESDEEGKII